MEEKFMIRRNNGITLIALVITIIVLLILAGVTIAMLVGENGILTKATDAKEKNEIAEVKERAQLDIASWVADRLENGEDATVNSPDKVREILDGINTDESKRYYKEVTDEGVVTPNDYIVPIAELYTEGNSSGGGGGTPEAGEEVSEKPEGWTNDKVTPIADGEDGVIPLPDGFCYVGGTKSEGIVISDEPEDKGKGTSWEVAKTLQGNQFVWVPVIDADFNRYEGYYNGSLDSMLGDCEEPYLGGYATEEDEYDAMEESVLRYDGFYVGRYEAGVEGGPRTSGSGITDEVVIKQGKNVYNYIGWSSSDDMKVETGGAVEKAKNLATSKGYTSVTSTLIYGVQWDAIMSWIEPRYKEGKNVEEELINEKSFVADSTGKGYYNQSSPTVTGSSESYAVKNIYDLAGNVYEWTMESYDSDFRVLRGRHLPQYRSLRSS